MLSGPGQQHSTPLLSQYDRRSFSIQADLRKQWTVRFTVVCAKKLRATLSKRSRFPDWIRRNFDHQITQPRSRFPRPIEASILIFFKKWFHWFVKYRMNFYFFIFDLVSFENTITLLNIRPFCKKCFSKYFIMGKFRGNKLQKWS